MTDAVHLIDDNRAGGVMSNLKRLLDEMQRLNKSHAVGFVNARNPFAARRYACKHIVVHFSLAWSKLPFLLLTKLLNPKSQLIAQEHHYAAEHFEHRPAALRRFSVLARLSNRLFDQLLAVSIGQAKWYRDLGISIASVTPPLAPLEALLTLEPRGETSTPVVGISGRLDNSKGIDLALQVLQATSSTHVNFLFAGYGALAPEVVAAAERSNNVRFIGPYRHPKEFLAHCDIVMVPSRHDTFGLTALEAKAAGKPILVTATSGLKDQAKNCGVAVERNSVPALVSGLHKLLHSNELKQLGKSAREDASHHNQRVLRRWTHALSGA